MINPATSFSTVLQVKLRACGTVKILKNGDCRVYFLSVDHSRLGSAGQSPYCVLHIDTSTASIMHIRARVYECLINRRLARYLYRVHGLECRAGLDMYKRSR